MHNLNNILRLLSIIKVVSKYDAFFILDHLGSVYASTAKIIARIIFPRPIRESKKMRQGQKLAKVLQELGPSFIKFGQTWSTRPDLIGDTIAEDLSELRDRLPPFSTKKVYKIIEKSFSKSVDQLFSSFESAPVAAASIAQVHFAVTQSGKKVAVKVLRPGIEEAFRKDIEFFRWIATIIDSTQSYADRLKPLKIIEKFEETTLNEMDLSIEAASASQLKENFSSEDYYLVPSVEWELTSVKVLTTERVNGISIGNREELIKSGVDRETLVENLLKSFLLQVFRDGFFHADLHQGNLFADSAGRILPVDFGIMGRMDLDNRFFLAELMLAFLKRDYKKVAEVHFEAGYVPKNQSIDAFALSCRAIGETFLGKPANEVSIGRLLYQLLRTSEAFKMETQPQLLLLQKTLVVAEGVARTIEPKIVLWDKAQNIIENWIVENLGYKTQFKNNLERTIRNLRKFPRLVEKLESSLDQVSDKGIIIHPKTIANLNKHSLKKNINKYKFFSIVTIIFLITYIMIS